MSDLEYVLEVIEHTNDIDLLARWFCDFNCFNTPAEFKCKLTKGDTRKAYRATKKKTTEFERSKAWHTYKLGRSYEEFQEWWDDGGNDLMNNIENVINKGE